MAWTITYYPTSPRPDQLVDVSGTGNVSVKCDVFVDDGNEPVVKGYLYDVGATPDPDPPGASSDLMVESGDKNGPYVCSGGVEVDAGTSGGYTKPTLTKLTLRVWAGRDAGGTFETKRTSDRTLWGYLPDVSP